MAKVDLDRLGKSRPKLEPDDLEEEIIVLTISGYEEGTISDKGESGERPLAMVTFQETTDSGKVLYLNKTMATVLVQKYGAESDAWIGKPVPLHKREVGFGNQKFMKVYVMPGELWDQAFRAAGVKPDGAAPKRGRPAGGTRRKVKGRKGR